MISHCQSGRRSNVRTSPQLQRRCLDRDCGFKHLEVSIGEQIDLGTINIDEVNRPQPKRKTLDQTVSFSGVVVDSDGNPVAGVSIRRGDTKTKSGVSGEFSVQFLGKTITQSAGVSLSKTGYGQTYRKLNLEQPSNQRLTIVNDDHPVVGRLLDPQGNPVQRVTIKVDRITQFNNIDLQQVLVTAKQTAGEAQLPRGLGLSAETIVPVTSAKDGSFSIRGIGSGRLAVLSISGETTAFQQVVAATAHVEPVEFPRPAITTIPDSGRQIIYGRELTIICEPSRAIQGTVVEFDSGEPIPGVEVSSYCFANNDPSAKFVGVTNLKTTTDGQGRFVLNGMPMAVGNEIQVSSQLLDKTGSAAIGLNVVLDNRNLMAQGWDEIPADRIATNGTLLTLGSKFSKQNPTAIKHVDIPIDGIGDLKFLVSRGPAIRIKTVDIEGNPISGVNITYIPSFTSANNSLKKQQNLAPPDLRRVRIAHSCSNTRPKGWALWRR